MLATSDSGDFLAKQEGCDMVLYRMVAAAVIGTILIPCMAYQKPQSRLLQPKEMLQVQGAIPDCDDFLVTFDCSETTGCYNATDEEDHSTCTSEGDCSDSCALSSTYIIIYNNSSEPGKNYAYNPNISSNACGKKVINSFCAWNATSGQCRCTTIGSGGSQESCTKQHVFEKECTE